MIDARFLGGAMALAATGALDFPGYNRRVGLSLREPYVGTRKKAIKDRTKIKAARKQNRRKK